MPSRAFTIVFGLLGMAFLAWVACFVVLNADVWWHIKAGQVMWETGSMMHVDPFAYTREGLPYLATHEWLAQLVFAGAYGLGGAAGIVWLRILCTLALFGMLLCIDHRHLWPNVLLAMAAAIATSQGLLERPQLFSAVLFALVLLLCMRLLDRPSRAMLAAIAALQILWVNLHGAAALLTFVPVGALLIQLLIERRRVEARDTLILLLALAAAMFLSPNLHENFTYLWLLFTDRTKEFLLEWNPSPWPDYLLRIGPFWLIALAALAWSRRKIAACALILIALGCLSRNALRHEILFLIAALAVTFYQLRHDVRWERFLEQARKYWLASGAISLMFVAFLIHLHQPHRAFLARSNLTGFGAFSPAEGAVDFLERNNVQDKIFNTYLIGGYLLFRDHQVFIDGRNDDYGYNFLKKTFDAAQDPEIWKQLQSEYGFTVAVIEYAPRDPSQPFLFTHLTSDPEWTLVYLDDDAAVYLKHVPENAALIERFAYRAVTPESLAAGSADNIQELERTAAEDSRGTHALLSLAVLHASQHQPKPAMAAAVEAIRRAPNQYEGYALLGSLLAAQEQWVESAAMFREALKHSRHFPVSMDRARLAAIFEKAGDEGMARRMKLPD